MLPVAEADAGGAAGVPVGAGAVFVAGTPDVASQPHGSVMVTGTGVFAQPVSQVLTVTVNPGGIAVECVAHVGVASVQLSVMVYVAGTRPVGQSDWYTVVYTVVCGTTGVLAGEVPCSHCGQ